MKAIGTRVFWSKKKFSFFCEERDKRERKNINFHPKNEKIQKKRKKKLIFLLFFALFLLSDTQRPKHLRIGPHRTESNYIILFRLISLLFVFCEVILYTVHTKTRVTEERGL